MKPSLADSYWLAATTVDGVARWRFSLIWRLGAARSVVLRAGDRPRLIPMDEPFAGDIRHKT